VIAGNEKTEMKKHLLLQFPWDDLSVSLYIFFFAHFVLQKH